MGISEHQGIVGMAHLHHEAPWMTRFLAVAMSQQCSAPISTIEVHQGRSVPLRSARQCQPGTHIVLWSLSQGCRVNARNKSQACKQGSLQEGVPLLAKLGEWGSVDPQDDNDFVIVGYTPKGIHKLPAHDRD